jgi:hypothetical protein
MRARWSTKSVGPREFGVLPTKQIRGGSTPLNGSNFSRPMEFGWCPPKALCGSSILPRESRYAAQAQMAGQVLGKDEMQGSIPWCGSNLPGKHCWRCGRFVHG